MTIGEQALEHMAHMNWITRRLYRKKLQTFRICVDCGHLGPIEQKRQGSDGVEIILWLFLLLPGMVYTVWRDSEKVTTCPVCQSHQTVPPYTPRGKELLDRYQIEQLPEISITSGEHIAFGIKAAVITLFGLGILLPVLALLLALVFHW